MCCHYYTNIWFYFFFFRISQQSACTRAHIQKKRNQSKLYTCKFWKSMRLLNFLDLDRLFFPDKGYQIMLFT